MPPFQSISIRHLRVFGLLMMTLFLAACASTAPSLTDVDQQMTRTATAVQEAEEVDAQEHAPLALRTAEQKLRDAQQAKAEGKHDKALRMAEQAQVDAELAEIKALSTKAQQAAQELQEGIRTLREEIARGQK